MPRRSHTEALYRVLICLVALVVAFVSIVPAHAQPAPDHLTCFKVKDPQAKTTYTADLDSVLMLPGCTIKVPAAMACVPTIKSNVQPPPLGGGGTGTPNAFGCYKVKCPKATPPQVVLNDQFGIRSVTPSAPKLLCAPVASSTTTTTIVTTTTTTLGNPNKEGTMTVADTFLVDPSATSVGGITGGSIRIGFRDLTSGGGTVVSGMSADGGCLVTRYDPSHPPHPSIDAGALTIANAPLTETSPTGLLKTVGPCTYTGGQYECVSNSGTGQAVTAVGTNSTSPGTVAFQFSGSPFAGEHLVGSSIEINGFTDAHYDSGASVFPIVAQSGNNTLVVIDPAGTSDAPEAATGISYTVLNGFGPIPSPATSTDFLATGGVEITKGASTEFAAIDTTIAAVPGQGWSLSDPGDPTHLPLTGSATNIVFGCGNGTPNTTVDDTCGNTTCGDVGQASTSEMIVSVHATKKSTSSLAPYQMPVDVAGVDTWLEVECRYPGSHSATLTQAALQAIMDFAPTRVEVQVMTAVAATVADGVNTARVVVGHALIGHTDHP